MLVLRYKKVAGLYIALSVFYIVLVLVTEPDAYLTQTFHLTVDQSRALSLAVAIPFLVIWFFALRAYAALRRYAEVIQRSDEWSAYALMTQGMLYGALYLPIVALLYQFVAYMQHAHPFLFSSANLFVNLVIVGLGLTVFVYMYLGSVQLLRLIQLRPQPGYMVTGTVFVFFTALYVILAIHRPAGQHIPTYSILTFPNYESDILDDVLIIFPRLVGWFLAVLTAHNLYRYSHNVQGVFYRQAFRNVTRGMAVIVLAALIFRSSQDVPAQVHNASIQLQLILSYVVVALFGVGFALFTNGTRKLLKIERING